MSKTIIAEINAMKQEKGWDKTDNPNILAKSIVVEANELLECFLTEEYNLSDISSELADVFMYAFSLADELKLDVDTIIKNKISEVIKRDYEQ